MTEKPKFINHRTKSLKIPCSEELALEIVTPIVNMTAYMLSVTRTNEMPSFETLANSVLASKTKLAVLIANKIGRPIDPKTLNSMNVLVVITGGYFKISLRESIRNKDKVLINQGFSITLKCQTNTTLLGKIMFNLKMKYKNLNIDKTSKEITEEATKLYMSIGL